MLNDREDISIKKEKYLMGHSRPISYEKTQTILKQMKNCICHIKMDNIKGTGAFCKIPYPDKNNLLPVLITNNHIIKEEILHKEDSQIIIYIKGENKDRYIELNDRIKYTNESYDITIIELKEKDEINNYLELDENIINEGYIKGYINEPIYIIQYPKEELSVSFGLLDNIAIGNEYNFKHLCSTENGSSGSPILNIKNNKLIGIHIGGILNNKYNYNLGFFLNFAIKDFIKEKYYNNKILKSFNGKYKTNINDYEIDLDLSEKKIGNEGLTELSKIKFRNLKSLYLKDNNLTDLISLQDLKFKELEVLNIKGNHIFNIDILDKIECIKLKELSLYDNNISNIDVFSKVKFEQLELLNLGNNKISELSVLSKVNFKELKKLNFYKNEILDISVLEKVNFEKLETLQLGSNKISNINILEKVNFKELKELGLQENKIVDINVLEKVNFAKLEILNLGKNNIFDINVLDKVDFKELKGLGLSNNNISDIKVLERIKFDKLKKIHLKGNKIDYKLFSNTIQFLGSKLEKVIL